MYPRGLKFIDLGDGGAEVGFSAFWTQPTLERRGRRCLVQVDPAEGRGVGVSLPSG